MVETLSVEAVIQFLEAAKPNDIELVVRNLLQQAVSPKLIRKAARRAVVPTRAWEDALEETIRWLPK